MISWFVERLLTLVCPARDTRGTGHLTFFGILLSFLTTLACLPLPAPAHVPVPDSVLNPQSAPEAWNVLRLAVQNIERLVHEDRLDEVPDQASLCSPALRLLAHLAETAPRAKEVAIGTVRATSAVDALAQACVVKDRASIGLAMTKLHGALDTLAVGTDPQIVHADIFFCAMHPEIVSADGKVSCPKCGMALTPRRIPYSFVYVAPPGEPSMRLTAEADAAPQAGQPTHVKIRLTMRDGSPVEASDLLVAHTQRIHLLIVDPTLEDYHHEHPTPTGTRGEYEFTFTPAKTTTYQIYADVVPAATGIQEYVPAILPGAAVPDTRELRRVDRHDTLTAVVDGLHFRLIPDTTAGGTFRAGQTHALSIMVRDADGQPFSILQPVMNAFAHLVGFYEDGRTVVHLHPAGAEVLDATARGGPLLIFRFYAPKEGFLRLYCQVSVSGKMIFAPFDLNIVR